MLKREQKQLYLIFIYGIFLLALILRFLYLSFPPAPVGIEAIHLPAAKNYLTSGSFAPDNWHTPPLKKILLFLSIKLIGDNSFGWRFLNAVFGSLTILYLGLIGLLAFSKKPETALTSSFLLAIDPLHITFSRTSFEDIPATFFLIAAVYYSLKYFSFFQLKDLLAAVAFFSLGMATRWYVLLPYLVFIYFLAKHKDTFTAKTNLREVFSFIPVLFFLPASIYLLTFYSWFKRGFSLLEWLWLQKAMLVVQASVSLERFDYGYLLGYSYRAWQWYLQPIAFGFLNKSATFAVLITTNPFVSLLVLPSLYVWYQKHNTKPQLFLLYSFLSLYIFFIFSPRPIFIYNSLSTLPFATVAVALLLNFLKERFSLLFYLYLVLLAFLVLLFFPLLVGLSVNKSLIYILVKIGVNFIRGID